MMRILKWTIIGLLARLILMPITMHGQDLLFINYFPMMFVEKGIWDPYGFISSNFPYFPYTYYGPVLFIIMVVVNFIVINLFHADSLIKLLELSSTMMFKQFTAVDYVHTFANLELFKNLFLMKMPYLIFDFAIGFILLKLALTKKLAVKSYKIWMLNIVVLHSAYMVGQFEVITAFFIIVSLFSAVKKRPYLSIIFLSLGGATKLFPYILIIPACLLLGGNWRKRFLLIFVGFITSLSLYLPFYVSSGNAVFGFFTVTESVHYPDIARWSLAGVFIILYAFICRKSIKDSNKPNPEGELLYYFIIILFLCYTLAPIRFRYFVPITPLLVLLMPQYKKLGIFTLFIVFTLAFLWLTVRGLQLGIFAPLNPAYFWSFPAVHEIAEQFFNIKIAYKIMARVSLMNFFIAAWWVWCIKLNNNNSLLNFEKPHT